MIVDFVIPDVSMALYCAIRLEVRVVLGIQEEFAIERFWESVKKPEICCLLRLESGETTVVFLKDFPLPKMRTISIDVIK